jgi:hypothetical protein
MRSTTNFGDCSLVQRGKAKPPLCPLEPELEAPRKVLTGAFRWGRKMGWSIACGGGQVYLTGPSEKQNGNPSSETIHSHWWISLEEN